MQRPSRVLQFLAQCHIGRRIIVVAVDIAEQTGELGKGFGVEAAMTGKAVLSALL